MGIYSQLVKQST